MPLPTGQYAPQVLLPMLRDQVGRVVCATSPSTAALTQRAVAGVLRLCSRLLVYQSDGTDELVDCLKVWFRTLVMQIAQSITLCGVCLVYFRYVRIGQLTTDAGGSDGTEEGMKVCTGKIFSLRSGQVRFLHRLAVRELRHIDSCRHLIDREIQRTYRVVHSWDGVTRVQV